MKHLLSSPWVGGSLRRAGSSPRPTLEVSEVERAWGGDREALSGGEQQGGSAWESAPTRAPASYSPPERGGGMSATGSCPEISESMATGETSLVEPALVKEGEDQRGSRGQAIGLRKAGDMEKFATRGDQAHRVLVGGSRGSSCTEGSLPSRGPGDPGGASVQPFPAMSPPHHDSTLRRSWSEPRRHGDTPADDEAGAEGGIGKGASQAPGTPLPHSTSPELSQPEGEGDDAISDDGDEVPGLRRSPGVDSDSESDPEDAGGVDTHSEQTQRGNAKLLGERPEWSRRRLRRLGQPAAHARFLQHWFRRSRVVRPGCWRKGGLANLAIFRPVTVYACMQGQNLASAEDFAAQARSAKAVLAWYQNYVELLRARSSGHTPTIVEGFCGGGGKSEGYRRARGASHGIDLRPQEEFTRRFGAGCFTQGDATSRLLLKQCMKATRAVFLGMSPPCKENSQARQRGQAQDPDLLKETRAVCKSLGCLYHIENVVGSAKVMDESSTTLRGSMFGLRVDRPRLFETNFPLHVDRVLSEGGKKLRRRCCMGARRRWRCRDPFGRPEELYCCAGNIFAVQGDKPWRCTTAECARAMGVDVGHMSYVPLAQSVPPVYGQLVFAQMCMQECSRRLGIKPITYDEMTVSPVESEHSMRGWLRGAGDASGQGAVQFVPQKASLPECEERQQPAHEDPRVLVVEVESPPREPQYAVEEGAGGDDIAPPTFSRVWEAEFREIYYSTAGGFDQQVHGCRHPEWLDRLQYNRHVDLDLSSLRGANTVVNVGRDRLRKALSLLTEMTELPAGSRVTVITDDRLAITKLKNAGYKVNRHAEKGVPAYANEPVPATLPRGYVALSAGRRGIAVTSAMD